MKTILFLILFCLTNTSYAQYPDGTLIFSSKKGLIGRVAKNMTGGDQYTHVGVVIDGYVYESDWPRAHAVPVANYGKPRTTNDYYIPKVPFSVVEVAAMRANAQINLGKPYKLRNYLRPRSKKTDGTWCSPYSAGVISASGRYQLSQHDGYEPQNLLRAVRSGYTFRSRIVRQR